LLTLVNTRDIDKLRAIKTQTQGGWEGAFNALKSLKDEIKNWKEAIDNFTESGQWGPEDVPPPYVLNFYGEELKLKCGNSRNSLFEAIDIGEFELVQNIIRARIIDLNEEGHRSPIIWVIFQAAPTLQRGKLLTEDQKLSIIKLALENGENFPYPQGGDSPLHYAINRGYFEIVKFLIEQCPSKRLPDYLNFKWREQTPISLALADRNLKIFSLLLKAGAEISGRDSGQADMLDTFGRPEFLKAINERKRAFI
jgi:hypothetical protein